jgi:cell division septation protein DedD
VAVASRESVTRVITLRAMSVLVARFVVRACVILTLVACANTESMRDSRLPLSADSENIRAVRGEPVDVSPLTPEPGDIWADLAIPKQESSPVAHEVSPTASPPVAHEVSPTASPPVAHEVSPTASPSVAHEVSPTASPPVAARPQPTAGRVSYAVQLTAANSENAAHHEWQQLRQRMPDVIGSHEASVVPVEIDGHQIWRLRTGGFATQADAAKFCNLLQSRHSTCWVVATGL